MIINLSQVDIIETSNFTYRNRKYGQRTAKQTTLTNICGNFSNFASLSLISYLISRSRDKEDTKVFGRWRVWEKSRRECISTQGVKRWRKKCKQDKITKYDNRCEANQKKRLKRREDLMLAARFRCRNEEEAKNEERNAGKGIKEGVSDGNYL